MTDTQDISQDFARLTAGTRYEDIPEAARDRAKQSILDTLGVIVAASTLEPAVAPAVELAMESGGRGEATVLGWGTRIPALMASFAHGLMAHCLDFDDHAPEGHHPSTSIIPPCFALAEARGGISGKEMIAATAIGQDIFLRLRRNVGWRQDWHLTTVCGAFSGAASAARVLGLSQPQIVSAFGIAGMQSAGTLEMAYGTGSDIRGMYAGFVSKAATLSAQMAERGIIGPSTIFEGKAGFFATYFDGKYDREAMMAGLGTDFTGESLLYKAWPSCGVSHSFIHATAGLMRDEGITPENIKEIRVFVGDFQHKLCLPLEARRAPKLPADAKFSIPYTIGVAAANGTVRLADFTPEGLKNPAALAVAQKVVPVPDPAANWSGHLPKGRIEMELTDGRVLSRVGDKVPGEEDAPMDWDYLIEKFREAASFSRKPLAPEAIERAQQMARDLETLEDATDVIRALS